MADNDTDGNHPEGTEESAENSGTIGALPWQKRAGTTAASQWQVLAGEVQRGDVVFYRPTVKTFHDLSSERFDEFRILAAFGQSLPYALQSDGTVWSPHHHDFKPWGHVAICVESAQEDGTRAKVAGFDNEVTDGASGTYKIRPLEVGPGQAIEILRPQEQAGAIADAAEAMDPPYSFAGLVAFSLATHARLIPEPSEGQTDERDDAFTSAYKAQVIARAQDANADKKAETCVTAAAKAIHGVGNLKVCMKEPAAPDRAKVDAAFEWEASPAMQMYMALTLRAWPLYVRAFNRFADAMAAAIAALQAKGYWGNGLKTFFDEAEENRLRALMRQAELLRRHEVAQVLADGGPPDLVDLPPSDDLPTTPGPDGVTVDGYLNLLHPLLHDLQKVAAGVAVGTQKEVDDARAATCDPGRLVASPAMLWDALIRVGFKPITPVWRTSSFAAARARVRKL